MTWRRDGSVLQSGMRFYEANHEHLRMYHHVVCVVEQLFFSDDSRNQSAISKADFRGTRCEADVICLNDGKDAYWRIPKVAILPRGSSGVDNYYEELPTPSTQMIDGTVLDSQGKLVDDFKLDGDFCLVGFVGGNINQPYLLSWWPHPGNQVDPATDDRVDQGYLTQGRRLVRRFQGTKLAITSEGSLYVDTSEANAEVSYNEKGIQRTPMDAGGDVRVSVKPGRTLDVNFNPPVAQPELQPDLLQPNPPQGEALREDVASRLAMTESFINLVAGRVVRILGNNDQTDSADTVLIGEAPTDHVLLGEKSRATINAIVATLNAHMEAYAAHFHLSTAPTGPTGTPIDVAPPVVVPKLSLPTTPPTPLYDEYGPTTPQTATPPAAEMPETDLSTVVKVQ